jgi:hypothetical protein
MPAEGDEHGTPTRLCPHCATVSRTAGEYCPQCGKSYLKKGRLSKRSRIAVLIGLLILVLGGAGAAIAIKDHQNEESRRKHAAAVAAAALAARAKRERHEEAQREAADEKRVQRESAEKERGSEEKELEKAVETDAKKLVSDETLSKPILGASCTSVSGGSSVELHSPTGSYDCIAITKRESGGEVSGYRFSGTIDFANGRFSYHLGSG